MNEPRVISLPKYLDHRGNLSFLENKEQIPFNIERVYWIYDVPGGEVRGGHAYLKLEEVIIALSGSFSVVVDNGFGKELIFNLNRSYEGLYVPGKTWRQLRDFSTNAVALIVASTPYDEQDYIYDYEVFRKLIHD